MNTFNSIKFLTQATTQFNVYLAGIDHSESFEDAKKIANCALGYLDCMNTFTNSCICFANNDFTGELGEVLDEWRSDIYQHMVNKAEETHQGPEIVRMLLKKRDGDE